MTDTLFDATDSEPPDSAETALGLAAESGLETPLDQDAGRLPELTTEPSPSVLELLSSGETPDQHDDQHDSGQLLAIDPDWRREHWQEMPGYEQQDLSPYQTVIVHLRNDADRQAFAALTDNQILPTTKTIWWPKAEIGKAADKRYVTADKSKYLPRYPVYIISKGRWESRMTAKAFEYCGVPYHIVIEPQEYDAYAAVINPSKILVLPFSNLGLGGIPARNWVWEHSISTGAERHWIFDDNISGFCRFHDNLKVEVDSGILHCAIEDFCDRYENVVMAGFNYDYFAPRKAGATIRAVSLNTRVYSGILLSNKIAHRWRGRYNEDTDLSLCILKDGYVPGEGGRYGTALFNAFLMYKAPTMTMKGGNATELYTGMNATVEAFDLHAQTCSDCKQCSDGYGNAVTPCTVGRDILSADGRWRMAESLREQHPDVTTVERKWGRWQHQVDYRRFRNNPLIPKQGHVAPEMDWSMELVQDAKFEETTRRAKDRPIVERRITPRATPQPTTSEVPGASALGFLSSFDIAPNSRNITIQGAEVTIEAGTLRDTTPGILGDTTPAVLTSVPPVHIEVGQSLADFLGTTPRRLEDDWKPDEIPSSLEGIDDLSLNFETTGLDVHGTAEAVGVSLCSLDGQLRRFLPFGFAGGNLPREQVIAFLQRELRGKHILNANTRFDVHIGRKSGVDFEEQANTVGDVQLWAALLDDNRKTVKLDILVKDYLGEEGPPRVDESRMTSYHASEVAERALYQVTSIARLRDEMWPRLDAENLHRVRQVEDDCIYPVVEMEKNGVVLDLPLLETMHAESIAMHGKLMLEVCDEAGFAFDVTASGWQRLFEKCGLKTSKSYAEDVVGVIDHPLIRKAHLAAQYASLNSKTFAPYKKLVGADGVLHFDINQLRNDEGGTRSGRFSIGYVQQVPNHDNHHTTFGVGDPDDCDGMCPLFPRQLFIAGEGQVGEADAMQIEYRLFAHDANNAAIIKAYQENPLISFHKMMWNNIKVYKPEVPYSDVKRYNFARQYGAKTLKLAVMLGDITAEIAAELKRTKTYNDPRLARAKELEGIYKKVMPEGDQLLEYYGHLAKPKCDDYCRQDDLNHRRKVPHQGYVETLLGRRSRFPHGHKSYIGLNRREQGGGADIMKLHLIELHKARKQTNFLMRLTVHDSVVGDARTPETMPKVKELLNRQLIPLRVPILWDCGVGANWAVCE